MRKTMLCLMLASGLTFAGCTDSATLPQPVPRSLEGAPIRRDVAMDPEQIVYINVPKSQVRWEGRTAVAYASMEYKGNRGSQKLDVEVLHGYSLVGSRTYTDNAAYLLGGWKAMGTALRYTVARYCGQMATLQTEHYAALAIPGTAGYVVLDSEEILTHAAAPQPACTSGSGGTCEEDLESTQESVYSPYPRPTCDGDTTGGGSGGSTGQPVDETWVEEMFGVRFRCTRSADPNFEVVTCVAENEEGEVQ